MRRGGHAVPGLPDADDGFTDPAGLLHDLDGGLRGTKRLIQSMEAEDAASLYELGDKASLGWPVFSFFYFLVGSQTNITKHALHCCLAFLKDLKWKRYKS